MILTINLSGNGHDSKIYRTFYVLQLRQFYFLFLFFLTKGIPKGKPQRWQESGSLGLPGERQGRTISPPPGRVSGTPALWYLGVARVPPPLPYGVWKMSPSLSPVGSSPLFLHICNKLYTLIPNM